MKIKYNNLIITFNKQLNNVEILVMLLIISDNSSITVILWWSVPNDSN